MNAAIEITRQALDAGKIVHTGWTPSRDAADQCGVNVIDYFDVSGKFLGADENGVEPAFEAAATQQTAVGTKVCTVGRDGAKCASHSAIYTGKIYEAVQRKDGMLVWSLVGKFGGTRTGKSRPSAKFVAELKAIAEYAWVDGVKQNQVCG